MASFRQHGNGWQARVRRKGTPDQTKSFLSLQDAQKWARSVEIEICPTSACVRQIGVLD